MPTGKRKKTTTVVEELPPNLDSEDPAQPTELDVSLESVEDVEALQNVLSQFGETNVLLKILRQTSGGTPEFCFQTDSLDEEFIQKNFGGGTYIVRIFINNKFRHHIKIQIASRLSVHAPNSNPNGDLPSSPDRHSEFLEKQAQRNHELLLAAISNKNGNSGPTLTEIIASIASLDQLRGKQESAMDLFQKGIDFAQSIGGQTDWKTDLIRTAKDVIPQVTSAIAGIRGTSTPMVSSSSPNGEIPMPPEQMIKAGIQYLKKKAIAGVDPDLIIEWVANNAEEYQGLLAVILNQEFSDIAKLDPEIGVEPFLGWFTHLFNGLRSAFKPEDRMDNDTRGDLGDTGNTGNNGQPRKTSESKPDVSDVGKRGV